MAAGLIDLDVRYLDVESGVGVAVDEISGRVKNALGVLVSTIVPIAMSDVDGTFYRFADFSIMDPAVYPGTFLTVDWVARRYDVVLPTFSKEYSFAPVSPVAADKTILYWVPYNSRGTLFYQITRVRGTESVLVGRSFGPSFVDYTVFPNEFDARSWRYDIAVAEHYDGPLQPDGSDYIMRDLRTVVSVMAVPNVFRTNRNMCVIRGQVVDLIGRPFMTGADGYNQTEVSFRQYEKDRHQFVGDTYVLPESVIVKTTSYGNFEIALIQDLMAEIWVPFSRLRGRFIVPRKEQAGLSELNIQILRE